MRSSVNERLNRLTLLVAAVLAALVALAIPRNVRLERMVNYTLPSSLNSQLVLVAIDEASLRDYGRMDVWPRELYAAALGTLQDADVKAVGVDVLLDAPSGNDSSLTASFSRPNVILATAPDNLSTSFPLGWTAPTGVSALNAPRAGSVSEVQTAYPAQHLSTLVPSFARQVAAQLAPPLPLDTTPRLIRYVPASEIQARTVSFRDVVNGNIRFADLQGKVALIGLTASGAGNYLFPDVDGQPIPGAILQLRAASSLADQPLRRLPSPVMVALAMAAALVSARLRGVAGFVLAIISLTLTLPAWKLNVVFPGVTISYAAILGTLLGALNEWWQVRRLASRDPITGLGNRAAFHRALDARWPHRAASPVALLLLDIDSIRQVRELQGRLAAEHLTRALAERLQGVQRRGDQSFRLGQDEFAILAELGAGGSLPEVLDYYGQQLSGLPMPSPQQDTANMSTSAVLNLGGAVAESSMVSPADLLETASRSRYRMKYQRETQGTDRLS